MFNDLRQGRGTVNINPFSGDVMFNFTTLNGILDKTLSYDVFHSHIGTVSGASPWQEAENLTLDRNAIDVIKHRSTIAEITDFHLESIEIRRFPSGEISWHDVKYQKMEKHVS